ncbi:MAG: recombinase family protein [Dehalococcoidia bacterium]|nr:recombinase family protein [Dehalococcoidia bacterium]
MRVAVCARTSSRDGDQNVDTQLLPLREFVKSKGWELTREYIDQASARDLRGRVAWRDLQKDARSGQFSVVISQRLDRIARSVKDLWATLSEWDDLGVSFVSLRENFDTSTAAGRLQMNIMAALAEFELDLIRDRIQDGLSRARAEGKQLGRPNGAKDGKKRRTSGYRRREAEKAMRRGE